MPNKITFKTKKTKKNPDSRVNKKRRGGANDPPKIKQGYPMGMTANDKFIIPARNKTTRTGREKHLEPFLAKNHIKPTVSKSVGVDSSRFTGTKSIFNGGKKKTKRRRKKKSNTRKKKIN